MSEAFKQFLQQSKTRVDQALDNHLGNFDSPYSNTDSSLYLHSLEQALRYSLLDGGKRGWKKN